jgi:hypothetical protein
MATHSKKRSVVDPSEARYTGEQRRAFGSALYEVEFVDGERRGEKIWVRQAPPRAGRRPVASETLKELVTRQVAEEAEAERRALDPNEPATPAGRRRSRQAPVVPAGTTYTRSFRGREVRCTLVVDEDQVGGLHAAWSADGEVFRSLTAAAEHFTGYKVSGPVFWGLR